MTTMTFWQRAFEPLRGFFAMKRDDPTRYYQWVSPLQAAGVAITNDSALQLSAVWGCVTAITNALSSCPWNVYAQRATKTGLKREILHDDPLAYILNVRPNSDMTAIALKEALFFSALTWGNGYAEIVRDGAGRIVEMWPLMPSRVVPRRDPESGDLKFEYYQLDGGRVFLDPEDVFHLHGPGITGLMGDNLVARAALALSLAAAQERFASTYFGNGTVIGGVLEYPGKMDKATKDRLKDDWEDRYKGPDKANRPAILEGGMKWTPFQANAESSQLTESRKLQIEEICRWFGVPPHKIQQLDRSTFNNIEHLGIEFVRDALTPWALRLEQEAEFKLIPLRNPRKTKLDMSWLSQGDFKTRFEGYQIGRRIGVFSANDILAMEGRNTIGPEGDVRIVESNMQTVATLLAAELLAETNADNAVNPPDPAIDPNAETSQDGGDTAGGDAAPALGTGKRKIAASEVVHQAAVSIFASVLDRYARVMTNREADLRRARASESKVVANLAEERERQRPRLLDDCRGAFDVMTHIVPTAQPKALEEAALAAADAIDNGIDPRAAAERLVTGFVATTTKELTA